MPCPLSRAASVFLFLCCCPAATVHALSPLPLDEVRYWAYQIQALDSAGAIEALAESRYDMLVLDPTVTTDASFDAAAMTARLKASLAHDGSHRKLVLAYIDIGQAEEWRWYWGDHPTYEQYGTCQESYVRQIQTWAPFVVACDPDGWAGNYPVAFWDQAWHEVVLDGTALGADPGLGFASMLQEVLRDGFDGVYLDWVEAWEMEAVRQRAAAEGRDPAREMLALLQAIHDYGRAVNPAFVVIQQNSSELLPEVGAESLSRAVDAIAQEGVWWDGDALDDDWNNPAGFDQASGLEDYYLPRLRQWRDAGMPVFVCDYAVKHATEVFRLARDEGFVPYATRRPLSRLSSTPPFPPAMNGTDLLLLSSP